MGEQYSQLSPSHVTTNNRNKSKRNSNKQHTKSNNATGSHHTKNQNNKGKKGRPNKNRPPQAKQGPRKGKFPWRRHIPIGSVDPITLESLVSLPYPPFALDANAPYQPISIWLVVIEEHESDVEKREEWQRQVMAEQWGDLWNEQKQPAAAATSSSTSQRHLNLFDGRALAYYMVSQLQFIDPLNRRDLTRDELCCLDQYLLRHGFIDLKVVEAYDAKGASISTAGAASTTAEGRMEMLQQEAQQLLEALFRGNTRSNNTRREHSATSRNNTLQMQYTAHQQQEQERLSSTSVGTSVAPHSTSIEECAIYEEEGLMIIDESLDPNLRSSNANLQRQDLTYVSQPPEDFPTLTSHSSTLSPAFHLWSANHLVSNRDGKAAAESFPALVSNRVLKKSQPTDKKSLKLVFKPRRTAPHEMQRQLEAREEAQKQEAFQWRAKRLVLA